MPTYVYPTASRLREIEQELAPRLLADDPLNEIMPIVEVDESVIEWEQEDNYVGLQQVRGLNGEPPRVARIGAKRYLAEPGVYGEFLAVDERELTKRRRAGQYTDHIDLTDLVMKLQDQLLQRRLDRWRYIGWTLLATGTFSVAGLNGAVIHTDSYTTQTYTAGVTWATSATATPLANLRAVKLLGRGKGVSFGRRAKAYMNAATVNSLLGNLNSNDLFGKRIGGGDTPISLRSLNSIFLDDDLPTVEEYDGGYLNDAGTFVPFIPNNKVVVVGERATGARIGEYQMTRNANNPNAAPGPYTRVIVEEKPPIKVEVHDGHNGGPALFFPSAVVVMTV